MTWVAVADAGAIEPEDVIEVSVGEHVLAIYRTSSGYFATDGFCTHERARLAEGLVIGNVIECPKHQGRFDVRDGAAKGPPASVPLCTHPVKIAEGMVHVDI
jgi:3-phenylpropionate/trans-cinnamate dioxygenase ferredoxin component